MTLHLGRPLCVALCILLGLGLVSGFFSSFTNPPPSPSPEDTPAQPEQQQQQQPPPPPSPPSRATDAYSAAISKGDTALRSHDLKVARDQYSAAIKLDSSRIEGYSKRAVVWLSLQRHEKAVEDLTEVLRLKPSDAKTLMTRGSTQATIGAFTTARADLARVLELDAGHAKASERLQQVTEAIEAELQLRTGSISAEQQLELLNRIVDVATHSRTLLFERARLQFGRGNYRAVQDDTATLIKIKHDDTDAYCLRGDAFFRAGDSDAASKHFKEALKFDPDQRHCRSSWKSLKTLVKALDRYKDDVEQKRYAEAIESVEELLELATPELPAYRNVVLEKHCVCLSRTRNVTHGFAACNEAIAADGRSVAAILARADLHIVQEDLQQALNDFNKILGFDENNNDAREGIQRVQRIEKQLKRKDYYKILGVKRDATAKEIKKAYRELLFIWHPDKNPEEKREEASIMFRDIKDAYDVLLDEEKRAKFDNGEDPLENKQNQQQHPHGFHFPNGFPPGTFGGNGNFHFQWG